MRDAIMGAVGGAFCGAVTAYLSHAPLTYAQLAILTSVGIVLLWKARPRTHRVGRIAG